MRHRAFFERLAAVDHSVPGEWETLSAALVTLRLVDDRLERPASDPSPSEITAVRTSVSRLDDGMTRRALVAMIDAVVARSTIAAQIVDYGAALEAEREYYVANDVYRLAIDAARHEGPAALPMIPYCLDRISDIAPHVGSTDDAFAACELGRSIAGEISDFAAALRINIAAANVLTAQGEPGLAGELLIAVVAIARQMDLFEPLAMALHSVASLAARREARDDALDLYGQALALETDPARRARLLIDLGLCARAAGMYDVARDAFEVVFVSASSSEMRWTGAVQLLDLHGVQEDWAAFDHYTAAIEPEGLPPRLSAAFHLYAADGEHRRGNAARAGVMLFIAGEIAARHGFHDIIPMVERGQHGEPIREPSPPRRTGVPDDVAAVGDAVRALRSALGGES